MEKPIDKSKKSNIKCEHCGNYVETEGNVYENCHCLIDGMQKNYWNRCKQFIWREDRQYVGELKEGAE